MDLQCYSTEILMHGEFGRSRTALFIDDLEIKVRVLVSIFIYHDFVI